VGIFVTKDVTPKTNYEMPFLIPEGKQSAPSKKRAKKIKISTHEIFSSAST